MCIVSMISTGIPLQRPPYNDLQTWPRQEILDLSEIIKRLDRIDKKLGLKDCKDDAKESFLKELEELVEKYKDKMPQYTTWGYGGELLPNTTITQSQNVYDDGHKVTNEQSTS